MVLPLHALNASSSCVGGVASSRSRVWLSMKITSGMGMVGDVVCIVLYLVLYFVSVLVWFYNEMISCSVAE